MTQVAERSIRPETPKKCYFSIVQYTPNRHRREAVNIAVVLEAPEFGYRGAKYLRRMDSLLRCVDPLADVEMIRTYVKTLENSFKRNEIERNPSMMSEPLFEQIKAPKALEEIIQTVRQSYHIPISITDLKPISLPSDRQISWKLESLYNSLIYRPREVSRENLDKDFVRRESVSILENFINISLDAEPIQGLSYEDNEFDAVQRDNEGKIVGFFEFISFDVKSPDTAQMKYFLETVQDVRKVGKNEEEGYQFHAIVQPPKYNKEKENEKAYSRALDYAGSRNVPVTLLDANAVAGLGQRLKRRQV